jgi:hypothetical protein
MKGHFQDVKTLVNKGVHSDSYARHFTNLFLPGAKGPTPGMQRDMITSVIIWKGNPMTVVKSFGKNSCKLYSCERMEIIKHLFDPECWTINSPLDIRGACRHLPRFHRLQLKTFPSADERNKKQKRVSVEQLYQASHRRLNDKEESLAGNEFDWIHSQPGIDLTELILDYFKPNTNDIILV